MRYKIVAHRAATSNPTINYILKKASLPMKKTSTSTMGQEPAIREGRRALAPKITTLAFLRQFARAYQPVLSGTLPGIILN